jgi:hypothetical protein
MRTTSTLCAGMQASNSTPAEVRITVENGSGTR